MSEMPKILIADDLEDMRVLVRLMLGRQGWEIFEAEDGSVAVELSRSEMPNVILMDYNMPILDGIEACKVIKATDETKHIPILIYTGASVADIRDAALDAGATNFLTKPILPPDLLREIKKALEIS